LFFLTAHSRGRLGVTFLLFVGLFHTLSTTTASADTLDDVRARGYLQCAVNAGLTGFAARDSNGEWAGFDADICRAVATAIFDDPDAVQFKSATIDTVFEMVRSGEVDMAARNVTWTYSRDFKQHVDFVRISYFDGQGFIVPTKLGIKDASQLAGKSVCVQHGTASMDNLENYATAKSLEIKTLIVADLAEAQTKYEAGECDAFTSDRAILAGFKLRLAQPDQHVLLPDVISKEPIGPIVREDDQRWADLVRWCINVMILAEAYDVSSVNAENLRDSSTIPAVRRLLGVEGNMGQQLRLKNNWSYEIIRRIGNYGELFERNLGANSGIGMKRDINALWINGGLIHSPPIR
jgi:general L-amino acid transport system substrate-binding protein